MGSKKLSLSADDYIDVLVAPDTLIPLIFECVSNFSFESAWNFFECFLFFFMKPKIIDRNYNDMGSISNNTKTKLSTMNFMVKLLVYFLI